MMGTIWFRAWKCSCLTRNFPATEAQIVLLWFKAVITSLACPHQAVSLWVLLLLCHCQNQITKKVSIINMWLERSENVRQKIYELLGPFVKNFALVYVTVISRYKPSVEAYKPYDYLTSLFLDRIYFLRIPSQIETPWHQRLFFFGFQTAVA